MNDTRRQQAETWAAARLGWPDWTSTAISSDAGFRRYYRLAHDGDSRVVMDVPVETGDTGTFARLAGRLRAAGLHAPHVDAHELQAGFMLLEDLGERTYLDTLDDANADTLFDRAVEALITMQAAVATDGLPGYDRKLLQTELDLFADWYLGAHLDIRPDAGRRALWDNVCELLIDHALAQPAVFVHRDYMPRNLMVGDPGPGIIDFQDAVRGPITYDPVCLFRDAFVSWPPEQVDAWLEAYRRRAQSAGLPVPEDPAVWQRMCDLTGAQRHLKVIGIFARLCHRDGKPRYLDDAPRFFAYLDAAVARNPELAPLGRLLEAWKPTVSGA